MTEKTVSEKDLFLQFFDREWQTTLKQLKAFPQEKGDFKPHERSKTAKQLAWMFACEHGVLAKAAIDGKLDMAPMPPVPEKFADIIPAFEQAVRETRDRIEKLPEDDLNGTMQFMVGPKQMGPIRRFDVLWMAIMDQIHHRGQFSVYLRMVGGKVPSIYGPTADEPWN